MPCLDKGYDFPETSAIAGDFKLTPYIRDPRRGVRGKVRTPGWRPALGRRGPSLLAKLSRNRALLIRWSKKTRTDLALLMLASGLIAFKKARTATSPPLPG